MLTVHVVLYIAGGLSSSTVQTMCGASSLLKSYVLLSTLMWLQLTAPRLAEANDAKSKGIDVSGVTGFMLKWRGIDE